MPTRSPLMGGKSSDSSPVIPEMARDQTAANEVDREAELEPEVEAAAEALTVPEPAPTEPELPAPTAGVNELEEATPVAEAVAEQDEASTMAIATELESIDAPSSIPQDDAVLLDAAEGSVPATEEDRPHSIEPLESAAEGSQVLEMATEAAMDDVATSEREARPVEVAEVDRAVSETVRPEDDA